MEQMIFFKSKKDFLQRCVLRNFVSIRISWKKYSKAIYVRDSAFSNALKLSVN